MTTKKPTRDEDLAELIDWLNRATEAKGKAFARLKVDQSPENWDAYEQCVAEEARRNDRVRELWIRLH